MRRRTRLTPIALLLAAGCTATQANPAPDPAPSGVDHAALVRRAHLEPCPQSGPSAAPRGLPAVTLDCLGNGPAVHLAGLSGTPTVVNVWGSWCGPCQRETPVLARVHTSLGGRVRFLGVDTEDSADSALDFAAHVVPPMRYPSVVDDDKQVLTALHTSVVPVTVFVRSDGSIAHVSFGPYDATSALESDIARYLGVRR